MHQKTALLVFLQIVIAVMAIFATADLFGGGVIAHIGAFLVALVAPQVLAIIAVAGAVQVWGWPWRFAGVYVAAGAFSTDVFWACGRRRWHGSTLPLEIYEKASSRRTAA